VNRSARRQCPADPDLASAPGRALCRRLVPTMRVPPRPSKSSIALRRRPGRPGMPWWLSDRRPSRRPAATAPGEGARHRRDRAPGRPGRCAAGRLVDLGWRGRFQRLLGVGAAAAVAPIASNGRRRLRRRQPSRDDPLATRQHRLRQQHSHWRPGAASRASSARADQL